MVVCNVVYLLVALQVLRAYVGHPYDLEIYHWRNDSDLPGIHSLIHDKPEFILLSRTYRPTYTIRGHQALSYYKYYYYIHVFSFVHSRYSRRIRIQVLVGIGNRHVC
jgi:hypothetical protein